MRIWIRVFMLTILSAALAVAPARAAEPSAVPPAGAAPDRVEEVQPEMYYLQNEEGDYVWVPNFSFEKWEQLIRQARNLSDPRLPAYVFSELLLDGQVAGSGVRLRVTAEVQQRQLEGSEESSWLRVPLQLGAAVLAGPSEYEGPGDHFLTFDATRDGYVLWIRGAPESTHRASLEMIVPLERIGEEYRLQLAVPTPLASQLTLRVPHGRAEGTIDSQIDNTSRPLQFTAEGPDQGQFTARGLRGEVVLKWHPSRLAGGADEARLDVLGTIIVSANELLQDVQTEGRFVVRSFGSPLQRFRVRLPPGMRLRESPEPGYRVAVLEQDTSVTPPVEVVEVQIEPPTKVEQSIRLIAELPADQEEAPGWLSVAALVDRPGQFQPARFEFPDVARHRGQIDFRVVGDWRFQWAEHDEIVRTEEMPAVAAEMAADEAVARFQYFEQPCDLKVALRQRATRINVQPAHELRLDPQQVRLHTELTCQSSGSKAGPLALQLRGWVVEQVQFDSMDLPLPLELNEVDPLVVPIPAEVQAQGTFVLDVQARRELTAGVVTGTQPLRVVMPQVQAANPSRVNLIVAPATVVISTTQNVVATPRVQDIQGLSALATPTTVVNAQETPRSLRYRDHGATEQAVFVCDFRVRPRSVTVSVDSTATIARDTLSVEQRLSYTVMHEPVTTLDLRVPAALVRGERVDLRLVLDEQPVAPSVLEPLDDEYVHVQVLLPNPLMGQATLRLLVPPRDVPVPARDEVARIAVPLAFPLTASASQTAIVDNRLAMKYDKRRSLQLTAGSWAVNETDSIPGAMQLTTASEASMPVFSASLREPSLADSTIVQQAWIQSWVIGAHRRDRAVFRVLTGDPQVRLELPQESDRTPTVLSVAIDGQRVQPESSPAAGRLVLSLEATNGKALREHVIEVWYAFEGNTTRRGRVRLRCARVDGVDRTVQSYWQLIMPVDDLLLWASPQLAMDWSWAWRWLGWQRAPRREQVELEDWTGATRQEPVPLATSRYLFTTFGAPERLEVVTVVRSVVVLVASGLALTVGLLLLYVRWLRHPAVLLALAVLVLAGAAVHPRLAVLAGQAGTLGLCLLLLVPVLRSTLRRGRLLRRAPPHRVPPRDSKLLEPQFSHEGSSRVSGETEPRTAAGFTPESGS